VPVGIFATASYQNQFYGNDIMKPTLCSNDGDEEEFKRRHKLVEELSKDGMASMIPRNLFERQDDKFISIPDSLMDRYRAISASGNSSISKLNNEKNKIS
jgi:hypothetical protein